MKPIKSVLRISIIGFLFIIVPVGLSFSEEQKYPIAPINVICPGTPGGTVDMVMKTLSEFFQESLGQPLIVTYKPGGGGLIGGDATAKAKPDGYTVGVLWVPLAIPEVFRYFQDPPYTSAQLKPVCKIANEVGTLVVKSDHPWNNLKDVVEYMKNNPGKLKFGGVGKTGSPYILMSKVARMENTSFTLVSYTGDPEVAFSVLGGHIPIAMTSFSTGIPHIKAGTLKALVIYAERRFELIPEAPTFVEQGYPPDQYPCYGLFAPKDTPDSIVQKISETVKKASQNPSFLQRIKNLNLQAAFENTDQYRDTLNQYKGDLTKSFKSLGFWKE